jgi:hypothetical protein
MSVLVLVFSHISRKDQWPALQERLGADTLIFHGDALITGENDNVLGIDAVGGYDNRAEVLIKALRHVAATTNYSHFMVVNDCVQTVDRAVLNALATPDMDYCGSRICDPERASRTLHMNFVPKTSPWFKSAYKGPFVAWCDGNRGYLLSRRAITHIDETVMSATLPLVKMHEIYEDLMVAKMLHGFEIYPKKRDLGLTLTTA